MIRYIWSTSNPVRRMFAATRYLIMVLIVRSINDSNSYFFAKPYRFNKWPQSVVGSRAPLYNQPMKYSKAFSSSSGNFASPVDASWKLPLNIAAKTGTLSHNRFLWTLNVLPFPPTSMATTSPLNCLLLSQYKISKLPVFGANIYLLAEGCTLLGANSFDPGTHMLRVPDRVVLISVSFEK